MNDSVTIYSGTSTGFSTTNFVGRRYSKARANGTVTLTSYSFTGTVAYYASTMLPTVAA